MLYQPMKNKISLILILVMWYGGFSSNAQTYPFYDDFESYTAFQVPSAYPGNIQVRLVHGTNNSQGLSSFMNTFTTKDSATSPLIGPLSSASGLGFDWRIVSTIGSSFVPANLVAGDHFTASISNDGINFQDILDIDHLTYVASTDFNHYTFDIGAFIGNNIYVKFTIKRQNNPDDYYVDIDNLSVSDTTLNTGINFRNASKELIVYPNPVRNRLMIETDVEFENIGDVIIFDLVGKEIIHESISSLSKGYIDTSSLKSGYYNIAIGTKNNVKRKSFYKE